MKGYNDFTSSRSSGNTFVLFYHGTISALYFLGGLALVGVGIYAEVTHSGKFDLEWTNDFWKVISNFGIAGIVVGAAAVANFLNLSILFWSYYVFWCCYLPQLSLLCWLMVTTFHLSKVQPVVHGSKLPQMTHKKYARSRMNIVVVDFLLHVTQLQLYLRVLALQPTIATKPSSTNITNGTFLLEL
ncbi:hypothetical protein Gasu2_66600 [Galdieria sulphuraria]|nr:hypothetical protein Gasu2_66600 [Galdieria sulphuraria]